LREFFAAVALAISNPPDPAVADGQIPSVTVDTPVITTTVEIPTVTIPPLPIPTTTTLPTETVPTVTEIPPLPTTTEGGETTPSQQGGTETAPTDTRKNPTATVPEGTEPIVPLRPRPNIKILSATIVDSGWMNATFSVLGFVAGFVVGTALACFRKWH